MSGAEIGTGSEGERLPYSPAKEAGKLDGKKVGGAVSYGRMDVAEHFVGMAGFFASGSFDCAAL
ncbi:hypothetical protein G6L85_23395 [Agrobacterium rhizogenes]|uniref:hypothetical protein n=1 Tax=Rhizobium rhizogenes TaxID=359 RepID=UPI001573248E|nr:hypothetical protein [Rhizobium rhizogenes]NTI64465.1 hypothetical protein [Rhizobium rhizogenes]